MKPFTPNFYSIYQALYEYYKGTILIHTEKFFRNLIKSNQNQIVFTIIFLLIWNTNRHVRLLFQINQCMVRTIWFRFDIIRFRKDFSVCSILIGNATIQLEKEESSDVQLSERLASWGPPETPPTITALSYWGVQGGSS